MKMTDKRFWVLLIVIARVAVASAQTVFSVDEIGKAEYAYAEKEYSRYNIIPADSITDNEIVSLVLKESQNKFERLDSVIRQEIHSFVYSEGFGFNKQRLLYRVFSLMFRKTSFKAPEKFNKNTCLKILIFSAKEYIENLDNSLIFSIFIV